MEQSPETETIRRGHLAEADFRERDPSELKHEFDLRRGLKKYRHREDVILQIDNRATTDRAEAMLWMAQSALAGLDGAFELLKSGDEERRQTGKEREEKYKKQLSEFLGLIGEEQPSTQSEERALKRRVETFEIWKRLVDAIDRKRVEAGESPL